jgi:MFS family permease
MSARQRNVWIVVFCGGLILCIGLGARQSFGIFQKPIAAELQVGRELWSFANALAALLMGVFSPFVGGLADRFGTAKVVGAGAAVNVAGLFVISIATGGVALIAGNILSGIGIAAASFPTILAAVGRVAPADKRSLVMGIATACGSIGQFAIVPFAAVLQDRYEDWHFTLFVLTLVSLAMIPLAWALRGPQATPAVAGAPRRQSAREALSEAFGTRAFWLLTIGYFVCGFHVTFVGLHLPPYIADKGVGLELFGKAISPAELGGWAIGLVGLFNIVGTILWGWLGGKHQRKDMLALLYFLRSLSFILFLILPLSGASVLIFAATLGFLWLGTVALTNALVMYIFGPAYAAMLGGVVFMSHQIGSFIGGWGGGRLFDLTGNYDLMWWISIGLGLTAAALNWPIREQPVVRDLAARPA